VGAAAGRDARLVEHLVGDPVPDAGGKALVQQHRLDGRGALAKRGEKTDGRWQLVQRVPAQQADGRLTQGVFPEANAAQPAPVRHHQLAAVVEGEAQLGEARGPVREAIHGAVRDQAHAAHGGGVKAARHAEVEGGPGPAIELEPEVLAPAAYRAHAPAREGAAEAGRAHALEDDGVVGAVRLDDTAPGGHALGEGARRLDFRKLRH
jgi:hypothetical protein